MNKPQEMSAKKSWYALGITALVIAPMMLLYAYLSHSTLRTYRQNGIAVEASVIEKERSKLPIQTSSYKAPTELLRECLLHNFLRQ